MHECVKAFRSNVLALPVMGVASESTFSRAGNIFTAKRSRLKTTTGSNLLALGEAVRRQDCIMKLFPNTHLVVVNLQY